MNKNLKSKKLNTNKGITLIALIITIIVLLILAVVAIRAVQGDGILAHARNARDKWKEATANEEEILQNYTDYIAGQIEGTPSKEEIPPKEETNESLVKMYQAGTLKIGDYVDYKPTTVTSAYDLDEGETPGTKTGFVSGVEDSVGNQGGDRQNIAQENLNWRVLGYDEEKKELLLISGAPTTQGIQLYGHIGYNNAEEILNTTCSTLYSNNSLGVIARSITMDDIDSYLDGNNFDKTTYGGGSTKSGGYGYLLRATNKEIYTPEDWTPSRRRNLTSNYFEYWATDYIHDDTKLSLLLGREEGYYYWLATRSIYIYTFGEQEDKVEWSVGSVSDGGLGSGTSNYFSCDSEGRENGDFICLRPIVSLKENVTIKDVPILEIAPTETWNDPLEQN